MHSFTRTSISTLQTDLAAAIKQVADKHNLIIGFQGSTRFSTTEVTFAKLTAVPKVPTVVSTNSVNRPIVGSAVQNGLDPYNTLESREYLNLGYTHGLRKEWLGKKFKTCQGVYTIIGLKDSYRKYPVIGISARNTRYKFAAGTVKANIIA
jgi:hypothetical protein